MRIFHPLLPAKAISTCIAMHVNIVQPPPVNLKTESVGMQVYPSDAQWQALDSMGHSPTKLAAGFDGKAAISRLCEAASLHIETFKAAHNGLWPFSGAANRQALHLLTVLQNASLPQTTPHYLSLS